MRSDGTLHGQRWSDWSLGLETYTLVDVNQDGYDDVFYTYFHDGNGTPELEYRYVVWYSTRRPGSGGSSRGDRYGFSQYRSAPFIYSGTDF